MKGGAVYATAAFERDPTCTGCDLDGRRRVGPAYVNTVAPFDIEAEHDALVDLARRVRAGDATLAEFEMAKLLLEDHTYAREVAADCGFPCPTCLPEQYRRWRNGCYMLGHARAKCEICGPKDRKR